MSGISSSSAIAVLAEDHRRIRSLFDEFEALPPAAYVHKSKVVARMIDLITVHAYIEDEVLYPRVKALVPDLEDEIDSASADHRLAEVIALELWTMRPEDERFTPRANVLIDHVREHLGAEEQDWFPRVEDALDASVLDEIGVDLVRARRRAPASPRVSGQSPPG